MKLEGGQVAIDHDHYNHGTPSRLEEFNSSYELGEVISRGRFSRTHRAVSTTDRATHVVKVISVDRLRNRDELLMAAQIWLNLKHPNVVELLEYFCADLQFFFVFDLLTTTDLFLEIVTRACSGFVYSESVASHYMKQILEALSFLHSKGIIHATLSPEKILLALQSATKLKLSGFDNAIRLEPGVTLTRRIDDPSVSLFQPPEVHVGVGSDVWAAGILLHVLLSGSTWFQDGLGHAQEFVNGSLVVLGEAFGQISEDAQDLLTAMLKYDPDERMSADACLQHRWIKERGSVPKDHLPRSIEALRSFNTIRSVKDKVSALDELAPWSRPTVPDHLTIPNPVCRSLDEVLAMPLLPDSLTRSGEELGELLDVYDAISQALSTRRYPVHNASLVHEFVDALGVYGDPAITQLLTSPSFVYLKAALQAHDVVASEVVGSAPGCSHSGGCPTPPHPGPSTTYGDLPSASPSCPPSGSASNASSSVDGVGHVTRVRLVQFQKNTDEPMGITLKLNDEGRCVVARIMHGGMIHRQSTLHVGDEIREINGISVINQSVDALQNMLRDIRGSVTLKIVPSYRSAPPACEIFVRAQFDYDPTQDDLIPCPQAGVEFRTGDVLQVISKDDHNWWQARHVAAFPALGSSAEQNQAGAIAGLIPSPELQEWRTACLAIERTKDNSHCTWLTRRRRNYRDRYASKQGGLFDQLDLATYEEVVRLPSFRRKTLVLLGAHGVGRRHIKNTLIAHHPDRFAYPIPHTTRAPRKDEEHGRHYFFVTHDQMMAEIQANEYLEYGTHDDAMYGTKLDTIRLIHKQAKIAILDVEPQALKILRTAEFSPFVVFIAAPNLRGLHDPDGSLERLLRESELLRHAYGHYFDFVVVNNDIDDTIRHIEVLVEKLHASAQWVPVSWVY